jgi:hypothetical protein
MIVINGINIKSRVSIVFIYQIGYMHDHCGYYIKHIWKIKLWDITGGNVLLVKRSTYS